MVAYIGVGFWRCRPTLVRQCETPQAVGRQPIQIPALFAYANLTPTRGVQRQGNFMKNIIILKATSWHGKSSTLVALARKLRENTSSVILIDETHPDGYDEFLVAQLADKRIGIITEGDLVAKDDIAYSLTRCLTLNTKVIFTASWNHGIVYDMICRFAEKNGYHVIETSPLYCATADNTTICRLNDAESNLLMSLINI